MQERHTFSTICIIRKHRSNTKGEVAIYLRITVDGVRAEIATKQFIEADKWNSSKGRVKGNTESARSINHSLEMLEGLAHKHYNDHLFLTIHY